jgi:hypothetical protein
MKHFSAYSRVALFLLLITLVAGSASAAAGPKGEDATQLRTAVGGQVSGDEK